MKKPGRTKVRKIRNELNKLQRDLTNERVLIESLHRYISACEANIQALKERINSQELQLKKEETLDDTNRSSDDN